MNTDKIRWKKPFGRSYHNKRNLVIVIAIFLSFIAMGGIFSVLTDEIILLYIFLILGLSLSLGMGAIYRYVTSEFPKKIGYDSERLYYMDREDDLQRIRFADIKQMTAGQNSKGPIVVTLKNGREISSGPGVGEEFGRSMLEEFVRWTNENTDKYAEVEMKDISSIPEVRKFVVEPSERGKRDSESINYEWLLTSIFGWISGVGSLIYLIYDHGFGLLRDPILFSLLVSAGLILWISYNASSHIRK